MNKRIIGAFVAVVLVGGTIGAGLGLQQRAARQSAGRVQSAAVTPSPVATPGTVSYAGVAGKTALELLKTKDPAVVAKGEGANAFVTTINGYKADDAKKEYWSLYVNGKVSEVGAGSYVSKAGDQIEWKIEKY
ncbi:MAG: hypothetical protein JWN01_1076 [Patescibacteria group bacterium]|nr:hypothetical protein [Patescibacteria group bacterium]